jgi:predicted alpha/beta-hydrolase family hydrolase
MLFVQGSRDAFGTPAELSTSLEPVSPTPTVHVIAGGDHSFKTARATAPEQAAVYANAQQKIVAWMRAVAASSPSPVRHA